MKALSVQQPWAWALFHGKPVENRDRNLSYRGPLLIHASKTFDMAGYEWMLEHQKELGIGPKLPSPESFNMGGFIGQVTFYDVVREYPSLWFFGPFGYLFKLQYEFDNLVPYRGMPGLFDVAESVLGVKNLTKGA